MSITLTVSASPLPVPIFATTAILPLGWITSPYGRSPAEISRLVYSTLLPSIDSTEILLSPSRVTSAILPSGVMATWLGPDLSSPKLTLPTGVSGLPAMEKTETVPSDRLATSARVPARLIDTPAAPCPACNCATTLGGDALRSITVSLSSGTVFFGSAGSILDAPVTSAKLSSRAIATLDGGPTTLVGAGTSAMTLGGVALRSMTATESAGGLAGTAFTPSMRTAFPSLAESASSPLAPDDSDINAASESAPTPPIWRCMRTSSHCADRYGLANAPPARIATILANK